MKNQHENFLENNIIEKNLTSETKVEGIGTVKTYGELNVRKLVERLLKSKYIAD
ncbi:hypothetical protein [Fictibacillus arsenicus]|uniref:hypothetical protein n=1 Tax=Fictibacillus arsenicus TaxID=255247 RepID=UPI000B052E88|nr:hypothetical protein [Fictibacillus arsenicus]